MNTQIEAGLKAWMEEALELDMPVFPGLTADEVDPSAPSLHCYVGSSQRAAGPLHRGFAKIIISTPAHAGDDSESALLGHRERVAVIRELLANPDASEPEGAFNSASGLHWKGGFLQGESEGVDAGRWVTTMDFLCGVSTSG